MSDASTPRASEPTVPLVPGSGYTQPDVPPLEPTNLDIFGADPRSNFSYLQPPASGYDPTAVIDPNPFGYGSNYTQPSAPSFGSLEPSGDAANLSGASSFSPPVGANSPLQNPVAYDYGYTQPNRSLPDHPNAVPSLILGLLSLFFFAPLGVIAWVLAARGRREVAANPGRWASGGTLTAGLVMGIIGSILTALAAIAILVFFLFVGSMVVAGG